MLKRSSAKLALAVSILAGLLGLTACSSGDIAYRPAYFGQNGQCYYVQTPLEAQALIADGLCQPGWVPVLAPSAWEYAYAAYLFGPGGFYVSHYVPVGNRVNYNSYSTTFVSVHNSDITKAKSDPKAPKYVGSDGKQYTASKVDSKAKSASSFGGGTRTGFGGGNRSSSSVSSNSGGGGTVQSGTGRTSTRSSSGRSSGGHK